MSSLLSVSEASKLLGVCENTLREWDDNGSFKAYRTNGGHRRYDLDDIRKYLDKQIPGKDHSYLEKVSDKDIHPMDLLYQKWRQYLDIDISEEHKKALAIIVENEKLYDDLIANPVFNFEQKVWLLQQIFLRSSFLKMTSIQPLTGPAGLVFYNSSAQKDTVIIKSDPVVAKIRASNFTLFDRPFDEMKEAYADAYTKDLDSEIFENLCKINSCDIEEILNYRKQFKESLSERFDYIIAPKKTVDELQNIDNTVDYFPVNLTLDKENLTPLACAGRYPKKTYSLPIYCPYMLTSIVAPHTLDQCPKILRRGAWFLGSK